MHLFLLWSQGSNSQLEAPQHLVSQGKRYHLKGFYPVIGKYNNLMHEPQVENLIKEQDNCS